MHQSSQSAAKIFKCHYFQPLDLPKSVTSVEQVMFLAVTPVEFNNKTILEVSFPKIHITARFAGTH